MTEVIPISFDGSDLSLSQIKQKIRDLGWTRGRINAKEILKTGKTIVRRAK